MRVYNHLHFSIDTAKLHAPCKMLKVFNANYYTAIARWWGQGQATRVPEISKEEIKC